MQREFKLAIVIDGNGQALIAELDETTGAIKKTHKATDLMGDASEKAGKKSARGARGLKTFSDRATKMQRSIRGAIGLLGRMGGVITGALGVGLSIGVAKTIEFGDQVNKLSTRLGASTEALSEYKHVANLTGVEFNQLTIGWQRQTRRIAEAARGFGEAQGALRELGLEAKDLKDLAPEDQFEIIADRMALVTSESDRVRIGMKLWDSEGVSLLQTIEGGSEAMRKMRQEARDLGLSLSREQAQQMTAAKDATAKLSGAVEGLTTSMAVNLAPTMTNITNFVTDELLPSFTNWLREVNAIDLAIENMSRKQADYTLGDVILETQELTARQTELEQIISKIKGPKFLRWLQGASTYADRLEGVNAQLDELKDQETQARARLKDLDDQIRGSTGTLGEFEGGVVGAGTSVKTLLEQFAGEATAVQQFIGSLQEQTAILGLSEEAVVRHTAAKLKAQLQDQALAPAIDELIEKYLAGKAAADEMEESETALNEARALQTTLLEQLAQKYDPVNAAIDQWTKVETQLLALVDDEKTDQAELARLLKLVALAREDETRAAEDQLNPHRQLISELEKENEAMALAITHNESLEIAKARLNGANEAEIALLKQLQSENDRLSDQYEGLTQEVDAFGVAINRGIERLDDTFQDLWRNVFSGTKNSLAAIKDLILNTFAEIAHALITRPIVVQISTAISGGLVSGAAGAAVGAGGAGAGAGGAGISAGAAGLAGGLLGAGGMGIANLFGSIPIAAGGGAFGGLFGGAAAAGVGNFAFMGAGILGGLLGDAIFGGQGGIGGGLGAMIGTAILPGIGTVIGGLLGGALGGLFKTRDPQIFAGGTLGATGDTRNKGLQQSDLGGFFIGGGQGGVGEFRDAAIPLIQQFDEAIAGILNSEQLTAATDALKTWSIQLDEEAITIENLLNSRFGAILSTFDADVQHFVNNAGSLEDQVTRLAQATDVMALMAENQALFGEHVFNDVVSAAEAIRLADEDIGDALGRLFQNLQAVVGSTQILNELGVLDPIEAYRQQRDLAGQTVLQSIDPMTTALSSAISEFDGTTESLVRVAQAAGNLRAAQVILAGQYSELEAQIAGFGKSIEDRIQQQLLGDAGFYDLLNDRFQSQTSNLQTLTDPQEISAALALLEETANNMIGLLSPEQIQAQGGDILAVLAAIRGDAEARRLLGLSELGDSAASTGDQLGDFIGTLGDPLEIAAGAQWDAAENLQVAADDLRDAASRFAPPGFGVLPGDGFGSTYGAFGQAISDAVSQGITNGASQAAQISQSVTTEVVRALSDLPVHLAQAVYAGVAQIQVSIAPPNGSSLTNA